jgi:hypothetical protein
MNRERFIQEASIQIYAALIARSESMIKMDRVARAAVKLLDAVDSAYSESCGVPDAEVQP